MNFSLLKTTLPFIAMTLALGACSSPSDSSSGSGAPAVQPTIEMFALAAPRFTANPSQTWIKTEGKMIPDDVIFASLEYKRKDEICKKINDPNVVTMAKSFDPRYVKNLQLQTSARIDMKRTGVSMIADVTTIDRLTNVDAGTFDRQVTVLDFQLPQYSGPILKSGYNFPLTTPSIPYQRVLKVDKDFLSIQDDSTLSEEQQKQMYLTYVNPGVIEWLQQFSSTEKNCTNTSITGEGWQSSYQEISYGTYTLESGAVLPAQKRIDSYRFEQKCDGQEKVIKTIQILTIKSLQAIGDRLRDYCNGVDLLSITNSTIGNKADSSMKTEIKSVSYEL